MDEAADQAFKADKGKLLAAIPFEDHPDALQELIRVYDYGARKYKRSSWRDVPNKEVRYTDAKARHFLAAFVDDLDEESECYHLAHEAWNCLSLLQMKLEKKKQVTANENSP